jgi:hypothetical protein
MRAARTGTGLAGGCLRHPLADHLVPLLVLKVPDLQEPVFG